MNRVNLFKCIRTQYKKSLIYTRLGYEKTNTHLDAKKRKQIDKWIFEAEALCSVSVIYKIISISCIDCEKVILSENQTLVSSSLANLLRNANEVVLMAATSGNRITNEIKQLQKLGEMSKALVYDAAASEITDAGLDWLMGYLKQHLIREGKVLTYMRYSPGYGDLNLSNQEMLYRELNLKELDIQITSGYMLVPEKTVMAITGIESPKVELEE